MIFSLRVYCAYCLPISERYRFYYRKELRQLSNREWFRLNEEFEVCLEHSLLVDLLIQLGQTIALSQPLFYDNLFLQIGGQEQLRDEGQPGESS